jgi:hypothetical protein
MFLPNLFHMKPCALLLLFCLITVGGYSQCADTFELKSVEQASAGKNDGKIVLTIKTSRQYTCELTAYINSIRTNVSEKSGAGSGTITFENLNNTHFYRITVTFPGESDPFCQSRVLDQIILTGNKRKL